MEQDATKTTTSAKTKQKHKGLYSDSPIPSGQYSLVRKLAPYLNISLRSIMAANRGDAAIRIFRAANELGLRTVAIHSYEDRLAMHRYKVPLFHFCPSSTHFAKSLGRRGVPSWKRGVSC